MKKILVATHGYLARGILSSIEMLAGTTEGISIINAYVDEEDLEGKTQNFISSLKEDDTPIVFTDLYGGSVNQTITRIFLENQKFIPVISGFNFPILLEIVLSTEELTPEVIERLVENSRQELQFNLLSNVEVDNDEEDFF
ncbi:PTS fructose transporter subunit IIA [Tetragenococcus halophilus]|uniref:PTS sugar transporter subunit IIA n=1 Tax=Tetragenococcus halophilus TaxID=51669 RepID=UPI002A9D2DFD|nr:PTS sugar transporter subunit IIA [Tetragenococcus halophilus]